MPQLDTANYLGQLFWLGVTFLLLFSAIQFYFYPILRKLFRLREMKLRKMLLLTKNLKRQIELIDATIHTKEKKAQEHVHTLIYRAEIEAQKKVLKHRHTLEQKMTYTLREYEDSLKEAQDNFFKEQNPEEAVTQILWENLVPFPFNRKDYQHALKKRGDSNVV